MADYKPLVFMSVMLISFWLMISYLTNSYFVIFLIVSNFILLFACCVSLSGYVIGKYVDGRQEQHNVGEIPTISGTQPFVIPEYPPTYEEATRNGPNWQQVPPIHRSRHSTGSVVICIPVEADRAPKYVNILPGSTSGLSSSATSGNSNCPTAGSSPGGESIYTSAPSSLPSTRSLSIDISSATQSRSSFANSESSASSVPSASAASESSSSSCFVSSNPSSSNQLGVDPGPETVRPKRPRSCPISRTTSTARDVT